MHSRNFIKFTSPFVIILYIFYIYIHIVIKNFILLLVKKNMSLNIFFVC